MTREEIVAEAKSWVGTPYLHQASLKGVACDCIGLIRGVYSRFVPDAVTVPLNYPSTWYLFRAEELLYTEIKPYLVEIASDEAKAGDILLFGFGKGPAAHCGIKNSDSMFIHSWMDVGKVVETRLDDFWTSKIRFAFQIPGVFG